MKVKIIYDDMVNAEKKFNEFMKGRTLKDVIIHTIKATDERYITIVIYYPDHWITAGRI